MKRRRIIFTWDLLNGFEKPSCQHKFQWTLQQILGELVNWRWVRPMVRGGHFCWCSALIPAWISHLPVKAASWRWNPWTLSTNLIPIQVKARLDKAWLESGDVVASSNPQFGTELAWEVLVRISHSWEGNCLLFWIISCKFIVSTIAGRWGATKGAEKTARCCASWGLEELQRNARPSDDGCSHCCSSCRDGHSHHKLAQTERLCHPKY